MASGVMPVVPNAGGLCEMFGDGEEGLFFEHCNTDSLRKVLRRAIDIEPARRREMGMQARQRIIERASWQTMMQRYLDLFRECRVAGF
jgi:glycosyltransferase involved in cell wall biosynthesis